MTDDFEARWRLAADADPMHATYPEAVPGYRRPSDAEAECDTPALPSLGQPVRRVRVRTHRVDRSDDVVIRTDHDTGGMIVQFNNQGATFTPDVPPVGAPVTVAEIRDRHPAEPFDSEAELRAALVADAVADFAETIGQPITPWQREVLRRVYATQQPGRWWDPRTWWRR